MERERERERDCERETVRGTDSVSVVEHVEASVVCLCEGVR